MRLAVLSDIHGNLTAFEAVLADLEAQGGADITWFLGDFVAFGPRPSECVQRLRAIADAVKDDDLDLTFPLPGNTDYKDIVQLYLNGVAVDSPVLLNDFIDAGDDTIRIKLSAAARKAQPEGKVFINYKITFLSGNNEDEDGPADQFYTTDFTVPGLPFPGALVFSDEVLQNGVTPAAISLPKRAAPSAPSARVSPSLPS